MTTRTDDILKHRERIVETCTALIDEAHHRGDGPLAAAAAEASDFISAALLRLARTAQLIERTPV